MKIFKENKNKIFQVTENQKLDLFNIEELEDRLEMASIIGEPDRNDICWRFK